MASNFVVGLLVSFQYEAERKSWCLLLFKFILKITLYISQSLQHTHSFGFVVCVEKQFLDKLILPTCDEKINKIAI